MVLILDSLPWSHMPRRGHIVWGKLTLLVLLLRRCSLRPWTRCFSRRRTLRTAITRRPSSSKAWPRFSRTLRTWKMCRSVSDLGVCLSGPIRKGLEFGVMLPGFEWRFSTRGQITSPFCGLSSSWKIKEQSCEAQRRCLWRADASAITLGLPSTLLSWWACVRGCRTLCFHY